MSTLRVVHVFTFKTGLLSRVAHDLRLSIPGARLDWDGPTVRGEVALSGLQVDGVMRDGRLDAAGLSARDRASIRRTATETLLQVARHPVASFEGMRTASALQGRLSFRGRSIDVQLPVSDRRVIATLRPSAWGIAPYRALMGAIQLQDRVRVEIPIPW